MTTVRPTSDAATKTRADRVFAVFGDRVAAFAARMLAGRTAVFFAALFVVFFAVFFFRELDVARRAADDDGLRTREAAPTIFWREKARREAVFAPLNAAPTQDAATRLLFEYFLDVAEVADERNFSTETRDFYRTTLTDARVRFRTDDGATERRRRERVDDESTRNAVETLRTWNDAELDAATAFLNEFSDVSDSFGDVSDGRSGNSAENRSENSVDRLSADSFDESSVASQPALEPFASLAELEKSADFRDAAVWLRPKRLGVAPVSVETAIRVAVPKTFGVWGVVSWFCLLPGTFFGSFFGADAAFFRFLLAKTPLRLGEKPRRFGGFVSPNFLIESFGATQILVALSSVRLLR